MPKLFTTAYLPPVSYLAAIAEEMEGLSNRTDGDSSLELTPSIVYIEACENYQKQSYRNRCRFYAADGIQDLNIPVVHEGGTHKLPISELKIDWSKPWLQQHSRALISAYRTSAYFEYYMDDFFAIYDQKPEKLIDLNTSLLRFLLEKLGITADVRFTSEYSREGIVGKSREPLPCGTDGPAVIKCLDLRESIHPKRPNTILSDLGLEKPYFQVFARKHGFQSDLSAIDLLFNEGPDGLVYLKKI